MIINLKKYQDNILAKIYFKIKTLVIDLFSYQRIKNLVIDSKHLDHYFLHKFPRLKQDINENLLCVSCNLCVDACPTKAISLTKSNMLNLPQSLTTGEIPSSFKLDLAKCTKCHLCADVCLVDAIDLNGDFDISEQTIDLVKIMKKSEVTE